MSKISLLLWQFFWSRECTNIFSRRTRATLHEFCRILSFFLSKEKAFSNERRFFNWLFKKNVIYVTQLVVFFDEFSKKDDFLFFKNTFKFSLKSTKNFNNWNIVNLVLLFRLSHFIFRNSNFSSFSMSIF